MKATFIIPCYNEEQNIAELFNEVIQIINRNEFINFIFVNNGLLRKYDVKNIKSVFKSFNLKLNIINAEHLFLKKLKNGSLFSDTRNSKNLQRG